jgi:hypothetical protein
MTGRAEKLLTKITAGGAAEVHAMIDAQVVEELFAGASGFFILSQSGERPER